jgi:hypothetical protein
MAPRGWYCFGAVGSGGSSLLVSPQPIDSFKDLEGPAIEIHYADGNTSGRFEVAEIIGRVFPDYKAFVSHVVELFDFTADRFAFGPYPNDTLTYRGNRVVEYATPSETEGLGTHSELTKNGSPILGVAILAGKTPDLLMLSVRLPPELAGLTSAIVGQVEREAR